MIGVIVHKGGIYSLYKYSCKQNSPTVAERSGIRYG